MIKDAKLLSDIDPEVLATYEERAGIDVQTLLNAIVRDRANKSPSDSSTLGHSITCNNPDIIAKGDLKLYEETKAFRMLVLLAEFRDGPPDAKFSLRYAYLAAGITRATMHDWRGAHRVFDSIMNSIQEEMVDTMRAEAYRRAVVGVDEPIVHQGLKTGETVKKFSDGLLQFTLMGYDAKFRAKDVNMNMSGSLTTNVNIEGIRDRLAQRLAAKAKTE